MKTYKTDLNRNVTDVADIVRMARALDTLVVCGRPVRAAILDIKTAFGLTIDDMNAVLGVSHAVSVKGK